MDEPIKLPFYTTEDNDCYHCKHEFYTPMGSDEYGRCEILNTDDKLIGCKLKEEKEYV